MASTLGSISLWAAFVLGLTGGFGHCLAMCGPFVAGSALYNGSTCKSPSSSMRFQAGYHLGRLITYSLLGLILGRMGSSYLDGIKLWFNAHILQSGFWKSVNSASSSGRIPTPLGQISFIV